MIITVHKFLSEIMSFWHKSIRGVLVGLMLLVTGAAPMVIVSVDNDNDDDTPPITVELNLVAPSRKSMHLPATQAKQVTATGHRETFSKATLASHHHPTVALEHDLGSPQLVVPLRT